MSRLLLHICFVLITLLAVNQTCYAQQETLQVYFKLSSPDFDYKDARITILKNGKANQTFNPPKRRVLLKLNYNEEYTLRFELDGCESKEIHVNTKNVPKHMTYELLEVAFEVELSKSFQFNEEAYINLEQISWYYDANEGLFDYQIDNFPAAHLEAANSKLNSPFSEEQSD